MTTYLELKAKAEQLMLEAEKLRVTELNDIVTQIKEKIQAYGLTAHDLGFSVAEKKAKPFAPKKSTARYRGPNGELWSGGRGRKPRWVTEALAKGKKLKDFEI